MHPLANHAFTKMNGLGNEIVVLDVRGHELAFVPAQAARQLAPVGFDQMMVLAPPRTPGAEALVRIYNCDGSEAGACGNGMRCVAAVLCAETGKRELEVETAAGRVRCWQRASGQFTVDMGVPRFAWHEIPLACAEADTRAIAVEVGLDGLLRPTPSVLNIGNPHAIFWVADVAAYDLARIGPQLEHHPMFPERINVSVAAVASSSSLIVRTWERGAGLTRACGSAACAAAVAAARLGLCGRQLTVRLPGGSLEVEWGADDHVHLTGPVEFEYRGRFDPELLASEAARS